ncbi:nuclear transport factor 2 family protein [Pedobacter sp. PLR]|uniref:nuclear transport factor 2 family protein n=1 Tax=Pedobacter sp. PLR TaxID=2994465 RepID=UPI0022476EE8|nr:nuclear transport factor 2 family protein [Pedobacter sp. PLR]MCX2452057.1 nuclear transport factor 2 family protein [Pedobacter sp. PLR]
MLPQSKLNSLLFSVVLLIVSSNSFGQTKQDSLDVKVAVLDYIESQHTPDPAQMDRALHPRMVKRTFWKDKETGKDYLRETNAESMILLAESYNKKKDKFPEVPKKEVRFLDVSDRTASIKLIADDWIDYLHLVKLNGTWKIINVLWQYHDSARQK